MSTVAPSVFVLKNYLLSIGTDSYEKAINEVTITPSVSVQRFQGGTPDASYVDASAPTWTVGLSYAQDWTTEGSLSLYLFNNFGTTKTLVFTPINGAGPTVTVSVLIVPGQFGGAQGSMATASVTLEVIGQPAFDAGEVEEED